MDDNIFGSGQRYRIFYVVYTPMDGSNDVPDAIYDGLHALKRVEPMGNAFRDDPIVPIRVWGNFNKEILGIDEVLGVDDVVEVLTQQEWGRRQLEEENA